MKTWETVESVDDLIIDEEKVIIADVEHNLSRRCPHLKKLNNFFYYCSGGIPEGTEVELDPGNPIIIARQEVVLLQLHCMSAYESCCYYNGSLPFPAAFMFTDSEEET